MTIRTKLLSLIALVAASLLLMVGVSLAVVHLVRIGSPAYGQIRDAQDLSADVLPPPAFVVESYLTVYEMVNAAINTEKFPKGWKPINTRCDELEKAFNGSTEHWLASPTIPDDAKAMLRDEVIPPAQAFFALRRQKLVPALQKEDFEMVNKVVFEEMLERYLAHRTGIAKLVDLVRSHSQRTEAASNRQATWGIWIQIGIGTLLLAVTAAAIWVVANGISQSLGRTVGVLTAMAAGDTSRRLEVKGRDEITLLSQAVNRTVDNMESVVHAVAEKAEALVAQGRTMGEASRRLVEGANRTASESQTASAGAGQVSQRMGATAANTDELRTAIQKISQSISELSGMVAQTSERTSTARDTITRLEKSSQEVGEVARLIGRIAEQTSTLALNATIQGAAAGEAGRGFLVVANEVKDLAKKTADATRQVAGNIQRIQQDTGAAVTAIGEIDAVVKHLDEFQQSVAAAMTEQSATTDVIAGAIQEVASSSAEIAGSIQAVNTVAQETGQAAQTVGSSAEAIKAIAEDLGRVARGAGGAG